MGGHEHGNQSALCTAQGISSLADTLSPPPKKKIHYAELVNWRHLPSGDKFHSILGDVLPV